MDEEVDPDSEYVNSVLAHESAELVHILSGQSTAVIMKLCQMMPSDAGCNINQASGNASSEAVTEHIKALLEYFRVANAADCRTFLQSMCVLCDNIPMHLESKLMSAAGYENSACEPSNQSVMAGKSPSPPLEQLIKRPRIDYWMQYIATVKHSLQRRWERVSEQLVTDVQLENVWVGLRTANRTRERPDQTPGPADKGARTPEPDWDYGSMDSRVTLENFLQGCAGKVTVLVGPAGSGKTLLMSCLGQQWAHGLGPIPSFCLFVLLEFHQLNVLSRPLSLSELLLRHYVPVKDSDHKQEAIVDYLLSNPEQSCWVLDGYDKFHSKITKQDVQKELLDPEKPLPVADLISGLLNRQLLPGCTLMVTCRVRDVLDLEGISDKVGQLLGWDCQEIKEYVDNYFGKKGDSANRALGVKAAEVLVSSRHLLAMASLPALCNISCICLQYLLLESGDPGRTPIPKDRGSETRLQAGEIEEKELQIQGREEEEDSEVQREDQGGRNEGIMMDGTINRPQPPLTQVQIPSTLTQVYLTILSAFLCRDPDTRGNNDKLNTIKLPQSILSHHRSELGELSQLAWNGLEESKILFMKEDISQDVLEFSIKKGLLSQVELRCEDGMLVNSYCFTHLTLQEFLAAVRIMTSDDVSDTQLKKRFSLRTRWMTKSDQRTVFTDSLHLFVCGLASPCCTPALVQLARTPGGTGGQIWVKKRQTLVLNLLTKLCQSNLTGPKILELCHCVQESQDHQLAKQVVGTRPTLELRNIRLLPNDIDALAFVVNSVGDNAIGLDFRACSMESECLDVLPMCQHIHYLSFCSRRYGDKFAEKLSSILPKFKSLRKLEFCGASLTSTGAASLASALPSCPEVTEINLSDNNLKDGGIKHIADIFTKQPRLVLVKLGRNNSSLEAVDFLIGKMSSFLNIQHIHADGTKELTVTISQNPDMNSHKTESEPTISLLNQKWSRPDMQKLANSLARCPSLSILNISGGHLDADTLRKMIEFLPKFNITKKIIVNDSGLTVEGLVSLTALLSDCPTVVELRIRLQSPGQVSIVFSGGRKNTNQVSKVLCLCCCGLLPTHLERVWRSLGTCPDLTLLDLSSNCLGNKGLRKLLDILPRLSAIQEINASDNGIGKERVVMLAGALCSQNNLTETHISGEQVILKFCPDKRDDKHPKKMFRMNNSSLPPSDMTPLCKRLVQCHGYLELDLSHCALTDKAIKNLLTVLPKMTSLQRLNVSHSITSTNAALVLVRCLTVSQRVTSVELRPQAESFIEFDSVKAKETSCRLTHCSLKGDILERLLEILQQGPQLADLDLSSNQLEDEGVKTFVDCLQKLKITTYVNLSNNGLTQKGLLDVADTLRTCDNVCGVEISLNAEDRCVIWFTHDEDCERTLSVTDSGLERDHLVRLAEIISVSPSPTKLEFKNNFLQSDWIEDFVKLLNSSQRGFSVSIDERWIRSEEAVSLLCRCLYLSSSIHTIRVQHTTLHLSLVNSTELTSVSDDSADMTPLLATKKIGLMDCAVEGHHLASMKSVIQRCPSLTELDLSHNSLGIDGAEFLCSVLPSLPNLTSLSIGSKEASVAVVEKLSEALLQAAAIQCLNLSGHAVSDTAAKIMTKMLPRLRSLNLSHCGWSASGGLQLIQTLAECVRLETLCLDCLQLNEDGRMSLAQTLRKINSLRSLKLNKIATTMGPSQANGVLDLLAAMEGLTQMQDIELKGWRMADRGIEELTRLLPFWTELRKISLSKNLISDHMGEMLLEALNSCTHLEELHLPSNSLGNVTAAKMALVVPSLTNITVLDISENSIGYEGSVSLSKAIMCMKNLTKIYLTSVGTSELCPVAASLAHCPLLQDVGLGWNNCGDKVALELVRVMPLCQKLRRIDLESNAISVSGAEALVKALQPCPALQMIRLWRNNVSAIEAQTLSLKERRLNFSST
uniref:NLR family, CARD domain containing 5 isoform X1 n=1 Tax=Gasterosteus aculeatus aculeatus TaxID=481459 RepID=UPI001A985E27|nr:NLR family, CARD domain containing 5 isoform X1 [Gasterosteus aculeatus aculeatus]XP_040018524.1 NLR family, CARD domain containing 5 isoform X1 [Gasterosteus aculeatus aculeatus]